MRIEITRHSGVRLHATVGGHEIVFDQPRSSGGTDAGPTPTDAFVASLAACVAYYAVRYLERHGHTAEGLRVSAEFEMAEHPSRVGRIAIEVRCPTALSLAESTALRAVVEHCTVHNTIVAAPRIDIA